MAKTDFKSIDEYITTFPKEVQAVLEEMRQIVKVAAPDAVEAISYQMPTFKLHGNLVHFAAFTNHIGLYPTPGTIEELADELAPYKAAKGTLQFPLGQPLPRDLITKVVQARVRDNLAKQQAKKDSQKLKKKK